MGRKGVEQRVRRGQLGRGNPGQYDYEAIERFLTGADAETLHGLGRAYSTAAQLLDAAEKGLTQHMKRLSNVWEAESQELSAADLKSLTTSASSLSRASRQFDTAMNAAYATLKSSAAGMPPRDPDAPVGALPTATTDPLTRAAADKAAQEHLAKTNASLASAFNEIPGTVDLTLPRTKDEIGLDSGAPSRDGAPMGGSAGGSGTGTAGTPLSSNGGSPRENGSGTAGGTLDEGHRQPGELGMSPGRNSSGPSDLEGVRPGPGGGDASSTPETRFGPHTGRSPAIPRAPEPLPSAGGLVSPGAKTKPLPSAEPVGAAPGQKLPPEGGLPGNRPRAVFDGRQGGNLLPGGGPANGVRAGGVIGGSARAGTGPLAASDEFSVRGRALGDGGVIGKGVQQRAVGFGAKPGAVESGSAPMGTGVGGSRGGAGERTRERASWLTDTDDLWRQDFDLTPPVIGES